MGLVFHPDCAVAAIGIDLRSARPSVSLLRALHRVFFCIIERVWAVWPYATSLLMNACLTSFLYRFLGYECSFMSHLSYAMLSFVALTCGKSLATCHCVCVGYSFAGMANH